MGSHYDHKEIGMVHRTTHLLSVAALTRTLKGTLTRKKSVTGIRVSMKGDPTQWRSATQKHVTLSVTKAEQAATVTCPQDMIYQKEYVGIYGATGGIAYDLGSK